VHLGPPSTIMQERHWQQCFGYRLLVSCSKKLRSWKSCKSWNLFLYKKKSLKELKRVETYFFAKSLKKSCESSYFKEELQKLLMTSHLSPHWHLPSYLSSPLLLILLPLQNRLITAPSTWLVSCPSQVWASSSSRSFQ